MPSDDPVLQHEYTQFRQWVVQMWDNHREDHRELKDALKETTADFKEIRTDLAEIKITCAGHLAARTERGKEKDMPKHDDAVVKEVAEWRKQLFNLLWWILPLLLGIGAGAGGSQLLTPSSPPPAAASPETPTK